jgi:hypothetical protein
MAATELVEMLDLERTGWTGWKLGGRNCTSEDLPDPNGRNSSPCQGDGRWFESRLSL